MKKPTSSRKAPSRASQWQEGQSGTAKGVVKSYHGQKGFGFISSDAVSDDIYFMRKDMPDDMRDVQGKYLEGKYVTFNIGESEDGRYKATSVALDPSEVSGEDVSIPGVIKSFSEQHGYGFIESSSMVSEVRFDRNTMRGLMPGVEIKGMLVAFKVNALPDGKLRASKVDFQSGRKAKEFKGSAAFGFQQVMPAMGFQGNFQQMQGGAFQQGSGQKMTGTVKSFNDAKGFGFIKVPGSSADVKFGNTDITGGAAISAGATVQFTMVTGPDGRMLAKQVSIGGGGRAGLKRAANGLGKSAPPMKQMKGAGKQIVGSIKSFNSMKGFGFISSATIPGDIFFMRTDLPPDGESYVSPGLPVSCQVQHGPDGRMRATNIALG